MLICKSYGVEHAALVIRYGPVNLCVTNIDRFESGTEHIVSATSVTVSYICLYGSDPGYFFRFSNDPPDNYNTVV